MGEALRGVGWSASQPGDLRENRRGEKNKTHTLKTGTKKQPRWSRAPRWPTGQSWVKAPGKGLSMVPGTVAHGHTPDTQRNPVHDNRTRSQQRSRGTFWASSMRREWGEALTVAEAVVERPRGRACDDGVLGDPCFGRGVGTKGEHTERKWGDYPQGVRVHGPGQLWAACLIG